MHWFELNLIFGNEAPLRTSVYRWYGEFNRGRSSLQDEFREDRPKSVVIPETIDDVRQLILQDRHMSYREIETTLGISETRIHLILHDYLNVKKICSRWMPHNMSISQKNSINQSCKSTSTIGSNACKKMGSILKNNKAIFDN